MVSERLKEIKDAPVTCALMALNFVGFVVLVARDGFPAFAAPLDATLKDCGANFGLLTMCGQEWRLVSSMFLHFGFVHFAVNMVALWFVGSTAEALFGKAKYLRLYFFSGIGGALFSIIWNPLNISVGASGALFGVYAGLLGVLIANRDRSRRIIESPRLMGLAAFIAGSFAFGAVTPGIDLSAHVGGFLVGEAIALIDVCQQATPVSRCVRVATVIALILVLGYFASWRFRVGEFAKKEQGVVQFNNRNFQAAIDDCSDYLDKNPKDADALACRAQSYFEIGVLERSIADFTRAIELDHQKAAYFNGRAWTFDRQGSYRKAIADADRALRINLRSSETLDTRGFAEARLGRYERALADFGKALQLNHNDGAAYFHRAQVYEAMGNDALARADKNFGTVLGYKPENWELNSPNLIERQH